jgi:cytosine/adenosine deaminase-related metal-dependent hydrolase
VDFTIQHVLLPNALLSNAFTRSNNGYQTCDVQVAEGKIVNILPADGRLANNESTLDPIGTCIDGQNKLLLPGFVNAHTHSSEIWQRGMVPLFPLELWLADLYDFAPLNPEQIYLSALETAVETLLSGGTTIVDHLVLIPGRELETIAAAVRAYQEIGIRAFIGPLIQDQIHATSIPSGGVVRELEPYALSTEAVLELLQEAIKRFHRPEAGIQIMVAPTGPQLCSDRLFKEGIDLSDRHSLCRHTHLLETQAQRKLADEKYGRSAVTYLHQLGFLNSRTSLAHCVWLDEADIAILAKTGATVVHNPLSNLRLGSGIAPILKYLQAGVNVAFGCDGSSSNDGQDLLEAIKIGSILHNVTDLDYRHWITPQKSVEMASLGAARGLGMADQLGAIAVGQQADLVLYDLTNLSLLPRTDPLSLLILGRPTQGVDSVWVKGDRVVADGKVVNINVDSLRQELFERSQWVGDRPLITAKQLEPHYRQVMNLPD